MARVSPWQSETPHPDMPLPAPAALVASGADPSAPCGWWDSSFDLRDGLHVTEFRDFTPLGLDALPLAQLLQPAG